jgi:hypothetical protein
MSEGGKGPDWNDIHRANPGAIRRAGDDPATDIAIDRGQVPAARPKSRCGNGGQGIDPDQIHSAIQRGVAADLKRGGTTVMQDADTLEMETIEWQWLHWLALGMLH